MSTQIDLGPVLSIPKGDWNADTTYEKLNIVRHNSASWICVVATSIGVEPTEDSTDWYLQVKDTSAVSSVNGMRGDVVISTTVTPDSASDDTSIANTEWVRDRIDEASNSSQSYTNNSISTATTSILNTAAQDASNKATTAVNQALASSAAKFATISTVDSLADRVDNLEIHDTEQDTAIAAAISDAASKYLPLTGGVMTGTLTASDRINLGASTDGYYEIIGGNNTNVCSRIAINGGARDSSPGAVEITARNSNGDSSKLNLTPGGTATWGGNDILTSAQVASTVQDGGTNPVSGDAVHEKLQEYLPLAGGTMTGILTANGRINLSSTLDAMYRIVGGNNTNNSPSITMRGCDDSYRPGVIQLIALNRENSSTVSLYPDGTFSIGGNEVLSLTASWRSGANWYRKYSDGWIEQGGVVSVTNATSKTVTCHTAFTASSYTVLCGLVTHSGNFGDDVSCNVRSRTTTSFTVYPYDNGENSGTASMCWYACGY